eukprot:m.67016 g.67016  ORF g.67016 m.67016 type:complete len:80 (+) comp8202_c3_seq1:274-513(+)
MMALNLYLPEPDAFGKDSFISAFEDASAIRVSSSDMWLKIQSAARSTEPLVCFNAKVACSEENPIDVIIDTLSGGKDGS